MMGSHFLGDARIVAFPPFQTFLRYFYGKRRIFRAHYKVGVRQVAQSVQRLATGWTVRESNPGGGRDIPHLSKTFPGAHLASCTMGAVSFPGVKSGRGLTLTPSTPSSAIVKKEQSYTPTPSMGRRACTEPQCLYKGELYFYFIGWVQTSVNAVIQAKPCNRLSLQYKMRI